MDRREFLTTTSSVAACAALPIPLLPTEQVATMETVVTGDPIYQFVYDQIHLRGMDVSEEGIEKLANEVKEIMGEKTDKILEDKRVMDCQQYVLDKLCQFLDFCKEHPDSKYVVNMLDG